jgi:hypothetical protein
MGIRTGEPDYRVFIFGNEVTSDVTSVNITWSHVNNNCTIELANQNEKYIVTRENKNHVWRTEEDIKKRVYRIKNAFKTKKGDNVYDLYEGECIFSCGDPVRVYIKDPFSTQWYRGYTGYATPITDSFRADFNQYMVTIGVQDTKRWIRNTRLVFGVWGEDGSPYEVATKEEMADSSYRSVWQEIEPDFTLPEYVLWIITGQGFKRGERELRTLGLKCGNFDKGMRWDIKNVRDLAQAQEWLTKNVLKIEKTYDLNGNELIGETIIDIEGPQVFRNIGSVEKCYDSNGNEVPCRGADSDILNTNVIRIETDWEEAGLYNVDGQVHVIMPEFLSSFTAFLPHTLIQQMGYRDEAKSRLSLIESWVSKLDFRFYALPNGDVLLEFPQYDLRPIDYVLNVSGGWPPAVGLDEDTPFRIKEDELIDWGITENDEKVDTLFLVGGSLTQYYQNTGDTAKLAGAVGFAYREKLVKRYGWKVKQLDNPFIVQKDAAQVYAESLVNKSFIDAKSMSVSTTPKFDAWPARPYKVDGRRYLGFCTSVNHVINWNSQCRSTFQLGYLRGWNDERQQWTAVGGNLISEETRDIDYSRIYGGS